mgnify:CR=1 FL=1
MLILVLAGVLFYPRLQAWFTPVPAVQIQMESSVLPDTAPNCTANPRTAAVLRLAMRDQTDAVVYDCDTATLEACMAELLDDPELWVRSYQYTVHGGLNAHITVTFDWVYPDDGPARRAQLARTADGLLAAAPAGDYPRALYLYDWLLTHVRYVARETYDQTAYAAVCEGEAVCGGIADAYVYLLERGGIPARVITGTSRSADATPGSRRSSTARSITSTPPGICRTTRARRRCRAISATRGSPSRPSAWPCATRPTIPPSGRTAAPTRIITTAAAAAAVRSQWDDGRAVLEFRCETPEVYASMQSLLFERDRLWDVYRALGSYVSSSGYQCADDQQIIRLIPAR